HQGAPRDAKGTARAQRPASDLSHENCNTLPHHRPHLARHDRAGLPGPARQPTQGDRRCLTPMTLRKKLLPTFNNPVAGQAATVNLTLGQKIHTIWLTLGDGVGVTFDTL